MRTSTTMEMLLSQLDGLSISLIVAMIMLAAVSIYLTFAAYKEGLSHDFHSLKKHCQFIGIAILVLMMSSFVVVADVAIKCSIDQNNSNRTNQIQSINSRNNHHAGKWTNGQN